MYFAPSLIGKNSFDKPQNIMRKVWSKKNPNKKRAKELAKIRAHAVIDGGATDTIGIATAVATGATEIFVVDVVDAPDISFKTYFAGAKAAVATNNSCSALLKNGFPFDVSFIFVNEITSLFVNVYILLLNECGFA